MLYAMFLVRLISYLIQIQILIIYQIFNYRHDLILLRIWDSMFGMEVPQESLHVLCVLKLNPIRGSGGIYFEMLNIMLDMT